MMLEVPKVPATAVRWGVEDAVLAILGANLLSWLWLGALLGLGVIDSSTDDAVSTISIGALVVGNVGLWVGYALGPWWVAHSRGTGPVRDFGLAIRPLDVPLGVAVGILAQLVLLPLLYAPIGLVTDRDPSEAVRELIGSVNGSLDRWLLVLSAVVLAPLLEELAFRGLLLRALQRSIGPLAAAFITAGVFAVVHLMVVQLPGLFLFGLLAAGLALWSGRLGPSIVMHVAFNATALVGEGLF